VQLTKDGVGICALDLRLDNSTGIAQVMKNKDKLYLVNGIPTRGWFTVDFTLNELSLVFCEFGWQNMESKENVLFCLVTS
jgi:hypothetical protein